MSTSDNRVARLKARAQKERKEKNEALQALEETLAENEELKKRPEPGTTDKRTKELEQKLRTVTYRAAFEAAAKKAGVKPEFVGDLFDLAKLPMDKDEPDGPAVEKHLGEMLKTRSWAVATEEPTKEGDKKDDDKGKEKEPLKTKEEPLPKGEGHAKGTQDNPGKTKSVVDVVNEDFTASGRTDPFKL